MGNGKNLGKMEKVDLREIWEDEAGDFTPWLAQEENIEILGNTIGMELEVDEQEKRVGDFRADIMAQDTADGTVVLIENQLERTNHTHLGQILTYAAGLEAKTVVWVAKKFTDEHRAALDWLNENTDGSFKFFGLEVELWKIGDSDPAPKFNIVSKPNDWSRNTKTEARKELTDAKKLQLRYWTSLRQYAEDNDTVLTYQKPNPQHWMNFTLGKTNCKAVSAISVQKRHLWCSFESRKDMQEPMYNFIDANKSDIEAKFGEPLELRKREESMTLSVTLKKDPTDESDWENQFKWFEEKLTKFDEIFRPIVKNFNPEDWEEPEEDDSE